MQRGASAFLASAIHGTQRFGNFDLRVLADGRTDHEHVVVVRGDVAGRRDVLVRVASECFPGMVLDGADCDCLAQLHFAMGLIDSESCGVVVVLRQEGRGHGLTHKVRALSYKNRGLDTFRAAEALGDVPDVRTYDAAADALRLLDVRSIRLITSNPDKPSALGKLGIEISDVVPTPMFVTERNALHLKAKVLRGHMFGELKHAVDGESCGETEES